MAANPTRSSITDHAQVHVLIDIAESLRSLCRIFGIDTR